MSAYQMSVDHMERLRTNRIYLLRNVNMTTVLLDCLQSKRVLTYEMKEEISAEKTTESKIGKMLDTLPRRGPNAFPEFISALMEDEQEHVALKLDEDLVAKWQKENPWQVPSAPSATHHRGPSRQSSQPKPMPKNWHKAPEIEQQTGLNNEKRPSPIMASQAAANPYQQLVECPLCLDQLKSPKLLPCGHSFCLDPCLRDSMKTDIKSGKYKEGKIRCPMCKIDHTVKGLESLPPDHKANTLISLIEQDKRKQRGKCKKCLRQTPGRHQYEVHSHPNDKNTEGQPLTDPCPDDDKTGNNEQDVPEVTENNISKETAPPPTEKDDKTESLAETDAGQDSEDSEQVEDAPKPNSVPSPKTEQKANRRDEASNAKSLVQASLTVYQQGKNRQCTGETSSTDKVVEGKTCSVQNETPHINRAKQGKTNSIQAKSAHISRAKQGKTNSIQAKTETPVVDGQYEVQHTVNPVFWAYIKSHEVKFWKKLNATCLENDVHIPEPDTDGIIRIKGPDEKKVKMVKKQFCDAYDGFEFNLEERNMTSIIDKNKYNGETLEEQFPKILFRRTDTGDIHAVGLYSKLQKCIEVIKGQADVRIDAQMV